MGGLILEIVEGAGAGTQVALSGPIEVGRSTEAQITLDDLEASRRHLRVEPVGDGAVVTDLSSTNGSFVNDQPIYRPRELRPGRPYPGRHDGARAAQR